VTRTSQISIGGTRRQGDVASCCQRDPWQEVQDVLAHPPPRDGEYRRMPSGTSGRAPTHYAVTILKALGSGVPHVPRFALRLYTLRLGRLPGGTGRQRRRTGWTISTGAYVAHRVEVRGAGQARRASGLVRLTARRSQRRWQSRPWERWQIWS